MTLQNRVDPWGHIVATAARGTMMGNRGGKIHRDDQTLGKRRWASTHWIACELHWKDQHHEPMGQGYTSLFFLDEVTALSAGHRPCFSCRRLEAKAFLGDQHVKEFDLRLHVERTGLNPARNTLFDLRLFPDGTMVEHESSAFAIRKDKLLRWSFEGYAEAQPLQSIANAKLLTPPSIIAILANGYQPRWHESANQWDAT